MAGLLQSMSVEQMVDAENNERLVDNQALMSGLAAHIISHWERNKRAKQDVDQILLQCLRQKNGEYDPEDLREIRDIGGSEIFMQITAAKCRAGASWIADILLSGGDKPWGISPSPVSELNKEMTAIVEKRTWAEVNAAVAEGVTPSGEQVRERQKELRSQLRKAIQEQAETASDRMEDKIEDQLLGSKFRDATLEFIDDFTTFPAAFMKGPVYQRKRVLKWSIEGKPVVGEEVTASDQRVSPFDAFPSPGATSPQDGTFIERVRFSRSDLYDMMGLPGYSDDALRDILENRSDFGAVSAWSNDTDQEQAEQEYRSLFVGEQKNEIEGIHFWGFANGQDLIDWGMDESEIDEPLRDYPIDAILVDQANTVIRAEINRDPLLRRPYYSACYQRRPGTLWGDCPPTLMRDLQRMCNGAARALSNNMGIASGPIVGILVDRMPRGESITAVHPLKTYQLTSDPSGNNIPPIQFYQAQSNANELMGVYTAFEQRASTVTGIPSYGDGDSHMPTGNLGDRGLAMLLEAMSKTLKLALKNIDSGLIQPRVERQYHENMLYEDDPSIKGDLQVVARGSSELINRAVSQLRRMEFLNVTNNPADYAILGMDGRADILREMAKDMHMERVIPDREAIDKRIEQQAQQKPQSDPSVQIAQMRIENEQKILEAKLADAAEERHLKSYLGDISLKGDMMELAGEQQLTLEQIKADLGKVAISEQGKDRRLRDEAAIKARFGSGI